MSDYHYGVNVLSLLDELAAHDTDDIYGGDFEVEGESPSGASGFATVDIPTLAEDAAKMIVALQQKLDAMAAENAVLKSNLMFWDAEDPEAPYDCPEDIANNCCIDVGDEFDVKVAAKMPDRTYRVSSADDYSCGLELVCGGIPETPATDTYLNSVRAEGVVSFIKKSPYVIPHRLKAALSNYAAQLRSGTHDTADKAG